MRFERRSGNDCKVTTESLTDSKPYKRKAASDGDAVKAKFAVSEPDPVDFDGLTDRQFRFASLRFQGMPAMDAYRAAYNCQDASYESVGACASRLGGNPYVIAKIASLRDQVDRQSTLSAALSRNFVINGLMGLAVSADKDSVKLGAYQTLGKTVGIDLFRETVRHENVTRTVEDVEQDLKDKLEQLRQGLTIEGKAQSIEDQAKPRDRRRKPTK